MQQEGAPMMVVHAAILTVILYVIMHFLLKQDVAKSWNRSILIGAIVLIYMILFGHGLPTSVNRNL